MASVDPSRPGSRLRKYNPCCICQQYTEKSRRYTDALTHTSFKTAAHTLFSTLPIIADIDGGSPHGTVSNMWSVDGSKANATRSSSAVSYLYPLGASRPNLSVLIGHQAKRIILTAGSLAKATGVEFGATPSINNGTSGPTFSASVRLDVLVSAGNYQVCSMRFSVIFRF